MTLRHFTWLSARLIPLICSLLLGGCGKSDLPEADHNLDADFEAFVPVYNKFIRDQVTAKLQAAEARLEELETRQSQAQDDTIRQRLAGQIDALEREIEKYHYRLGLEGYFTFKTAEDIPGDLVWNDGMDQPPIGDPRATKGGTFRMPITSFPATLRRFGPNSNHAYRSWMYDDVEIPLVNLHPITQQFIPGLAKRWALGGDGRTVFYELDPAARYSNGQAVRARDFMLGVYVRASDRVVDPFYKQYLKDQIANITVYDDLHLSISLPDKKPLLPFYASVIPASPKFYSEYGPDFRDRYNWRFEPTTGPYFLAEDDLKKGRSFTLTRDQDWWLKDHKYYRNMFNPDRMVFSLVRNTEKSFEMFRAGDFDYALVTAPEYWYEKSEIPPVFNGYIERYTFYNQYPRVNRGFYINTRKPLLNDRNVRIGIAYASNWQRVIDAVFQGDYSRLPQFSTGFGAYTNPEVQARSFSVREARDYFARAGFTDEGTDGILIDEKGRRLSIQVTSYSIPIVNRMMSILKEEAKKAGLEFVIDSKEPTSAFKYSSEKKHEMVFSGFGITPPFPRYHQFFHSSNALTSDGSPKPGTNNLFGYANPEMDRLATSIRNANDLETIKEASWKAQQMIHDEALFVPAYMTDYVRVATWRWVRWPDTESTPFCTPIIYEPFDSHLFWIDQERKQETRQAMKAGQTFREVQRTIAKFRSWSPPLTEPLPPPGSQAPKAAAPKPQAPSSDE